MKKRIFALLTVLCLCVGMLAACGSDDPITQEKAVQIAVKEAGISEAEAVDLHVHVTDYEGIPCYNIHFTANGVSLSYDIHAVTGEILSAGEGGH